MGSAQLLPLVWRRKTDSAGPVARLGHLPLDLLGDMPTASFLALDYPGLLGTSPHFLQLD